tara:strand:+ start:299 stop:601 length:303 start_codon:yes stop_codon:yes gene_type:complete
MVRVTVVPSVEINWIVSPSPMKGTPGGELESITVIVALALIPAAPVRNVPIPCDALGADGVIEDVITFLVLRANVQRWSSYTFLKRLDVATVALFDRSTR